MACVAGYLQSSNIPAEAVGLRGVVPGKEIPDITGKHGVRDDSRDDFMITPAILSTLISTAMTLTTQLSS